MCSSCHFLSLIHTEEHSDRDPFLASGLGASLIKVKILVKFSKVARDALANQFSIFGR